MAHLLYKWINDDVVLSKKISNFAKDFSNGYLFADLLRVYNQINDFELYVNKSASSAKITNFCRLEPVFRSLGIKFDSKIAFECAGSAELHNMITHDSESTTNKVRRSEPSWHK